MRLGRSISPHAGANRRSGAGPPVGERYNARMNRSHLHGRAGATTLILIAAVAVAIGFLAGSRLLSKPETVLRSAVMYPVPAAVPEFSLRRADGATLTLADWRGHWTVVFFGFTHCPDICPNTLAVFKQVWTDLAAKGLDDRLRFDFISVDPQRDTPELLTSYVGFFHPAFVAATGSDDELTGLTRALGLVYARGPVENGTYTVDHSASVVIVDPQGRRAGLFRPPFDAPAIAADLATLAGTR